jgi:type VI secretion system protein ImpH
MADEHGPPPRDLSWIDRLAADASTFGFHVALRRIDAAFPELPPLGGAERPSQEPVRLGQSPASAFEPNELTEFVIGQDGSPSRLTVAFLGLWGPNGPLPAPMTEYARDRLRHAGDPTITRFADVFHQRMLLLLHRAWARTQPTVAMDRPAADTFALYVGALMGLGLQATRRRNGPDDHPWLHYAGRLGASTRNADGLRDIIADRFGLPTAVEEFVGAWLDLPEDARWTLGVSRDTGTLGRSTLLGARAWSRTHKFAVVLGPLAAAEFERMLPGSAEMERLAALVRFYTSEEWECELRLVLAESAIAPMQLGRAGRLGWTTRIGTGPGASFDLVVDPVLLRTRRQHRAKPAGTSQFQRGNH